MLEFDVEAEKKEFERELLNGEFTFVTTINSEEDYLERKQDRDTAAIDKFLNSKLFDKIKGMK